MFIFVRLVACVSSLASRADNARCRFVNSVEQTLESVAVIVVGVLKKGSKVAHPLPPPPTRTLPLLIPPTPALLTYYNVPWALWVIVIPLVAVAVFALAATAAKMGVASGIHNGSRVYLSRVNTLRELSVLPVDPRNISVQSQPLPQRPFYAQSSRAKSTPPAAATIPSTTSQDREEWDPGSWTPMPLFESAFPDGMLDPLKLEQIGHLGAGGFGAVSKCKLVGFDQHVAVKRIPKRLPEEQALASLIVEVQAHLLLDPCSAFPDLHGVFETDDSWFLVMDCGVHCFADIPPFKDRYIAQVYGAQLAGAVWTMHAAGIVHFDLKPANLILADDFRLQVVDFGLADVFEGDEVEGWPVWHALRAAGGDSFPMLWPGDDNPEVTRARGGTRGYRCPQAEMGLMCSYAADLWALGVILYRWYTDEYPAFHKNVWQQDSAVRLSTIERDFFTRIFSCEQPVRFESWEEISSHQIWFLRDGEQEEDGDSEAEEDDGASDAEDDDKPSC
ncbi:kinase-like domain-containing protein [Mycena metata]|uniref:Kinase-like domain-containing protein n=1 Tax=Mycena metata TaxID=1033252 RepID=A0AAD7JCG7_9AGAR|nr:kinase-like domain-containing protein [Mycena metata]